MRPVRTRCIFAFGDFQLDVAERLLTGPGNRSSRLTSRLLDVLLLFVEQPGRLLDKRTLMDAVWQQTVVEENALNQVISALRRALGDRDRNIIETVAGIGYRFVPAVKVLSPKETWAAHTLAVLPFEDLGRERDHDYFAAGLTEELLGTLARVKAIRVIGRTSSFHFGGRNMPATEIGKALAASHLVTGAVRKAGKRLRISVQLTDTQTGIQIWSATFDRELKDVVAVQEDIAHAVAEALYVELRLGEASLPRGGTSNVAAYDAYLRGRAVSHQGGGSAMVRAAELYREALAADPQFALAWVGLAEASRGQLIFAPERAVQAKRDLEEAARQAVACAPDWWMSHIAQEWRDSIHYDWRARERALMRARELAGDSAPGYHFSLGNFLAHVGRSKAAVDAYRAAVRQDPLALLLSSILQKELHCAGQDEAAEAEYRRSLDLPGNRDIAEHIALHRAWRRGDPGEINSQFERYLSHRALPLPCLDAVFACNDAKGALEILRAASVEPAYGTAPQQAMLAWWLAYYGDPDAAIAALWRAYVEHSGAGAWLWLPVLAEVRRKPKFKSLVRHLGLVDYWRSTGEWNDFSRPIGTNDFECF